MKTWAARKVLVFLALVLLLPLAQAGAQQCNNPDEQLTVNFTNGQALFPFSNNVAFKIIAPACTGQATVGVCHVSPNTLKSLMAPEVSGSCIKRTGSNKCPRFEWTSSTCSPPFEVRIFYASDNPLGINPRLCVCDSGFCECSLNGYFPFAPTSIGPDGGYSTTTTRNSTFFAASLAIPAGAQGVATILDPLGNNTSLTNPLVVNGGSNLPLKVLLCHGTSLDPCDPITDAQILVSIYRIDPSFQVVLPLPFPGESTPPPVMDFADPHYRFNWTTPTEPGLYNVSFIFLSSNTTILTAFVRVPTP